MSNVVYPGYREEDLMREGLKPKPETWEDGLRADTGPGTFEWWYFDAHFEDGSTAVIVFYTKPILNRDTGLMPGLSLTITRPDGKKLVRFLHFPPGDFFAAKNACDVRIGGNGVKGSLQSYTLHVDAGDLAADLEMASSVPAWRPGVGMNYYDPERKRFFAWLAAVPYGQVSGTLRYDGQTHPVQGSVYHDHNWGNVGLNQVMSHWYWGRARVGEYTCIFVEMTAAKKYGYQKMPVFMLARDGEILIEDGQPLQMETGDFVLHSGGRQYPRQVGFHWESEIGKVHIRLSDLQIIEATSLLGALPRWKQALARLAGANPYYFRFNAAMQLEVKLAGTEAVEHGRTLYEIMLLR